VVENTRFNREEAFQFRSRGRDLKWNFNGQDAVFLGIAATPPS